MYLDNHATTRLDPRVLEVMMPWLTDCYANAGSTTHEAGREARDAVETARESFAVSIGATSREIVFTSGATESTNIAMLGLASRARHGSSHPARRHLILAVTDHSATLDPAEHLEREGFEVTRLPVVMQDDATGVPGRIRAGDLHAAIRPDTFLVSLLLANNEIGVIQEVAELASIAHAAGAVVHIDCAQALGRMPLHVDALGADLASFSAHKCHGPKGSGALFVRRRARPVRVEPLVYGGGQERGMRSGTLDVAGIVGLAEAARLAVEGLATESPRMRRQRDRLWQLLAGGIAGLELNGPPLDLDDPDGTPMRLVNNLNVHVPGVDGQTLLATLSAEGLAVSSGSACSSENPRPSHVLMALGRDQDQARASLRFGLSRFTTEAEIDRAAELIVAGVAGLRTATGPPAP
jgi:cysteine desulfurase